MTLVSSPPEYASTIFLMFLAAMSRLPGAAFAIGGGLATAGAGAQAAPGRLASTRAEAQPELGYNGTQ